MPDRNPSLINSYNQLLDQIVEMTLKGKIRSKEQVYQMLAEGVEVGTGEVFERCLSDRLEATQQQRQAQTDELKIAKANRILRALQTVQGEWQRRQEQNQATAALTGIVHEISQAAADDRLHLLFQALDPNQPQALGLQDWNPLAKALMQQAQTSDKLLQELGEGIQQGLASWERLSQYLVSWIYDQSREQLGFGGTPGQRGPWALWAKQSNRPHLESFFQGIALEKPISDWTAQQSLDFSTWVELALVLQCLQRGLVNRFDQLVYDNTAGAKLSISVYLTFAAIWSQLANGFNQVSHLPMHQRFANSAFQITLQLLRTFAQRDYFPLYGGIFASFAGSYLRNTLDYLDEPLRRTPGTQEKARILVLLGYSCRVQGQYDRAHTFHQQALDIAREAGDRICEIACLNHLSRTSMAQKQYAEAIQYSQRALVMSRQAGDRPGEANALANLGYSEVFQAQQAGVPEPEIYEAAITYLQQGLNLSEKVGDGQSRALCCSSLGIAHVVVQDYGAAIPELEQAIRSAQFSGDLYLYGLSLSYLGEAYYHLGQVEAAIVQASLAMYQLEQIGADNWRQPAGLLAILQGQLGAESFQASLERGRPQIIAAIGVDGYDYLPGLLQRYRDRK
ncbi:hypothetical protein BST81_10180 [Leptolyngbya sp. 'hensonii']|uniref:tetratricopeptide repeat protein n=1 Tax=Leptolyngbya sp. 'hensonii' TaxID=1922337 RepID=UPI0009502022|nr:tetratricopeptide repeat protein [Leptolyngbya sp. 'hensonii']OLP18454.1 hypothetical protein BST81_10180 [Leptolyngbya sp. 'hensonii']